MFEKNRRLDPFGLSIYFTTAMQNSPSSHCIGEDYTYFIICMCKLYPVIMEACHFYKKNKIQGLCAFSD